MADANVRLKKIQVGTLTYQIDAKYLLDSNGAEKSYEDIIGQIKNIDFFVCTEAGNTPKGVTFTPKGSSTSITGTLEASSATVNRIYLVYNPSTSSVDAYDEYIVVGSGTSAAWEKIGKTVVDLSNYVQYGTTHTSSNSSITATGEAGAATVTTSSAGSQTATGSATITYKKADAATGSAHGEAAANTGTAGAISYSPVFTGTAGDVEVEGDSATIDDHSYTPAGSVSLTPVDAETISINHVTGATLAAAPTFNGAEATISVSGSYTPEGSIDVAVNKHEYTPEGSVAVSIENHAFTPSGTISAVSAASHTHTVEVNSATIQPVISVDANTGSVEGHSHSITTHSHGDDVEVLGSGSTFTPNGTDTFSAGSLPSITIAAASTGSAVNDWEVDSDGVLKLKTGSFVTSASSVSGWSAGSLPSFTQGSKASFTTSTVSVAGVGSVATLTSTSAGGHSHSIGSSKSASAISYVTGIKSVSSAGGFEVTPTFTGASVALTHSAEGSFTGTLATLTHTVGTKSFTGTAKSISLSGAYTPEGTVSKPAINLTATAKTVAVEGIKSVTGTFTGTAATLSHSFTDSTVPVELSGSYTPAGTINGLEVAAHSHSYVKPADHTHGIGLTDTSVTGTAAVAVGDHTHSVTIANHTHSMGHTHTTTLTK